MGTTKSDKLEGLCFDLQSSYSHGPTWIPLECGATSVDGGNFMNRRYSKKLIRIITASLMQGLHTSCDFPAVSLAVCDSCLSQPQAY